MATMAVTANKRRTGAKPAPHRHAQLARPFFAFMAMAFAPAAHAIDWLFEPNLYAAATVTDNVNQSESNRKDALILNLMPGFTLQSKGSRRVQASLQYGLSSITRFGAAQHDDLFHNLNAVGHAELIDDFLFVDGS